MITYKINVLEALKEKGYTTYVLRKNKLLSERTIASLRAGKTVSVDSLNAICIMLRKDISDVLELEITDEEKIKYFM